MCNAKIIPLKTHDYSCNRYIVYNEDCDTAIVIDPGCNSRVVIDELNRQNKKLGAILLTHAHYDHIESVTEIKKATDAPVYLGERDVDLLSSDGQLDWYFAEKLNPFMVDNRLIGGDIQLFGLNIKVIETPGHTHGGLTYVIGNDMFSGDTLFFETYGRTDLPGSDINELISSAKKLFSLSGDYVMHCGHGKDTTLSHERVFNPIKQLF